MIQLKMAESKLLKKRRALTDREKCKSNEYPIERKPYPR